MIPHHKNYNKNDYLIKFPDLLKEIGIAADRETVYSQVLLENYLVGVNDIPRALSNMTSPIGVRSVEGILRTLALASAKDS